MITKIKWNWQRKRGKKTDVWSIEIDESVGLSIGVMQFYLEGLLTLNWVFIFCFCCSIFAFHLQIKIFSSFLLDTIFVFSLFLLKLMHHDSWYIIQKKLSLCLSNLFFLNINFRRPYFFSSWFLNEGKKNICPFPENFAIEKISREQCKSDYSKYVCSSYDLSCRPTKKKH